MENKFCLIFLILCTTLSQGFATLSNNGSANSPDRLVREKRVIDRTPNANTAVRLRDVNYIVNVQENNVSVCAGTILSANVILAPCSCVLNLSLYTVISGTIATRGGRIHTVDGILRHPSYVVHSHEFNIALLSISESITFGYHANQPISIIPLNNAHLPPNTLVTVSGYGLAIDHRNNAGIGCGNLRRGPPRQIMPNELRSIQMPTISAHDCRIHHHNDAAITPQNVICTHHEDKFCGPGDSGSPLVYGGHLFGILSWDGGQGGPEVFVNLADPVLRNWVYANMDNIPHYVRPVVHQEERRRYHNSQVHPSNDV